MGIPANPPPQSRLPDKILNDDELRDYFVAQQEDLYRLWLRSGGGTDQLSVITEETTIIIETLVSTQSPLGAMIDDINERLGSGDTLTWDETGFSWDSTNLTFDQTEA